MYELRRSAFADYRLHLGPSSRLMALQLTCCILRLLHQVADLLAFSAKLISRPDHYKSRG